MSTSASSRANRVGEYIRAVLAPERRAHTLLVAVCLAMLGLGVDWRIVRLGYPSYFTFDEHHFVENARNYIVHKPDWNDHPPLGKLILVPAMLAFGDTSFAWRFPAMALGLILVGISYLAGVAVFQRRDAGLLAAAFVAVDGFFISFSRTALLDIPMVTLMASSFVLMMEGRSLIWFLAAALLLGGAVAVKWIAGCLFLVAPLLLMRKGRSPFHAAWMLGVIAAVYVAIFWGALVTTGQRPTLGGIVTTNWELLKHHAGFTDWHNPADSRWYAWPFLTHPIFLHLAREDGRVRAMSTVGNVLLWFSVTAGFALAFLRGTIALWRAVRGRPIPPAIRRHGVLLFTAAVLLVQWYFTNRESYIWHYLASYYFGILLWVGMLTEKLDGRPWWVLGFVTAVLAVSIFYAPAWTNGRLSSEAFHLRFFPWSQ
jgi:dolichyl-phosphate-mannose--protein O-mannosyl transferase